MNVSFSFIGLFSPRSGITPARFPAKDPSSLRPSHDRLLDPVFYVLGKSMGIREAQGQLLNCWAQRRIEQRAIPSTDTRMIDNHFSNGYSTVNNLLPFILYAVESTLAVSVFILSPDLNAKPPSICS